MIDWMSGPLLAALIASGTGDGPSIVGLWQPPQKWPVIAIHSAVLPTGKVLQYSYPTGPPPGSTALLWEPGTGLFTNAAMSTDIFCSGLSMLPDGSVFVAGGNDHACDAQGRLVTHTFNPFTETWSMTGLMTDGRWYPTVLQIGDGSALIMSGLNLFCEANPLMERFVPGSGLELVPGGSQYMALFPRTHLLTSGKIARVGPDRLTFTYTPGDPSWQFIGATNFFDRHEGTSVLIPGRTDQVLIIGGQTPLTGTCEIIDFSSPDPQWQYTGSLSHPRAHADALILPDKTVMVAGGGEIDTYESPVKIPELFDPQTGTWRNLAPHTFGRMYHATTVLLPDGRVLLAGQDDGPSVFSAEIYFPPYLFRGPRPGILAAPGRVGYGRPFSVATDEAAEIGSVALLATSTVTHSFNTTQRYVGLEFEVINGGVLRLAGPVNGNHAPPGYYMLFVVNDAGVPSVARFVQVGAFPYGDIDGDGLVTIVDFLLLLGNWGPCAGCNADIDGDGVVGILDFLSLLANWS